MRNPETWTPSKFVYSRGRLMASHDPKEVGVGSRLITNLVARCYESGLKEHARGRLADLGCGKVPLYEAYKSYVSENICVDWANSPQNNDYVDRECDLTGKLDFRDEEFDTVILSDVLEHLPRPEDLWNEVFRILKEGGKVIMNVPFYYWLHETPNDYYRFTEYALRRHAESSGFKIIALKPIGGAPEIVTDILAKNLVRFLPRTGKHIAIALQAVIQRFVEKGAGKKLSDKTGKRFPLGYFLVAEKTCMR